MAKLTYLGAGDHESHNFQTDQGLPINVYIAEGIPTPQTGQAVECEVETKTSKAGKTYSRVTSINGQKGTGGYGGGRGGGRGGPSYDNRTFVSNVVGQAIAAGAIKTPQDLAPWANEAYKTIQGLGPAMAKASVAPGATPPAAANPSPTTLPQDDIPF